MKHINKKILSILKEKLVAEKSQLEEDLSRIAVRVDDKNDWAVKMPELDEAEEDPNTQADRFTEIQQRVGELNALEGRLQGVVAALVAIKAGTYGITAEGNEIPLDRLMANPAAMTLVE